MTNASPSELTELCLGALLRCIRGSVGRGLALPNRPVAASITGDMLCFYWALSEAIAQLAETVVHHPRCIASTWDFQEVVTNGDIPGAIDAGATVLLQESTSNPCVFVVYEPTPTTQSALNHLVQWCLSTSLRLLLSTRRRLGSEAKQMPWLVGRVELLEMALRNQPLHEIASASMAQKRPGGAALRQAAKSRMPVYQQALTAYRLIEACSTADESAIRSLLASTLVADLPDWQRFELAVAASVADALSRTTGIPAAMHFPIVAGRPLAVIGDTEVYWQYRVPPRQSEDLDYGEKWGREIASALGVDSVAGRADVGVCHAGNLVALLECKYYQGAGSTNQAVQDAVPQLVSYVRDFAQGDDEEAAALLRRSAIVVAGRGTLAKSCGGGGPVGLLDLHDLASGSLGSWAKMILHSGSAP